MSQEIDLDGDDLWKVMESMFEQKGLVKHHINSYNAFIDHGIQEIIDQQGNIDPDIEGFEIELGDFRLGEPKIKEASGAKKPLTPHESRIRDLTYSAPIYLEMSPILDGQKKTSVELKIGEVPIMLKSNKCLLEDKDDEELIDLNEDTKDPGGYFIVNGTERVIIALENLASNYALIEKDDKRNKYVAKVFSERHGYRGFIQVQRRKDGKLYVTMPGVQGRVGIVTVMRSLGLEEDKEIVEAISHETEIQQEVFDSLEGAPQSREEALLKIGNRVAKDQPREFKIEKAEQSLDRYLFPHISREPDEDARLRKGYFLGMMAQRVIELFLGQREEDDKDHYANKRLKLAGNLLGDLLRSGLTSLVRDMKYQLVKFYKRKGEERLKEDPHAFIEKSVRSDVFKEKIMHAMATGTWPGNRTGVSQLLDRTNYMAVLTYMRKIVSPLSRNHPHFEARDLHATHWGRLCPSQTPEGPNCGLVKHLALMADITTSINVDDVKDYLREIGMRTISELAPEEGVWKIYIDGGFAGTTKKGKEFVQTIKEDRRNNRIPWKQLNVSFDEDVGEIYVNGDYGRVTRPLIIVDDGEPRLKQEHIEKIRSGEWVWEDLTNKGVIEYLDASEEDNSLVAMREEDLTEDHTHMEIYPPAIFGVSASMIPYSEHNAAPRNTYGSGMIKQSLGLPSVNYRSRTDTRGHVLHYPETPLVKSKTMKEIGFDDRPAGQNFVVGILSHQGYNIEDAIIMNKSSIERGLSRSTFMRTYDAEEKSYPGGQHDKFEKPEVGIDRYKGEGYYKSLDEDGLAIPESGVEEGDVIIGRTTPPRFLGQLNKFRIEEQKRRDDSITVRPGEEKIDRVFITESSEGNKIAKVKVRDQRVTELGDKFASRHGQKGVVGLLVPEEDMPFTEDGVVPDLILNPHAIPSRMTVGQLLEMIGGKIASLKGERVDGTPFQGSTEEELREALEEHNFKHDGTEIMYDGITGEKMETNVFIGSIYYQKLHHMVKNKIHARARGPRQILTKQPTAGRPREGGLRFGEMEKDVIGGHGASMLLRERLLEQSDESTVHVCESCGSIATEDARNGRVYCPVCGEEEKISEIELSYAFKILLDELKALGISTELDIREMI